MTMPKSPRMVMQQDQSDCGVACLLAILRFHQGNDTLDNLRRISGTTTTGTTLLGLYQAAGQLSFDASGCEGNVHALMEEKAPCILHVQLESGGEHYVVCFGTTPHVSGRKTSDSLFIIGDPASGIQYLTPQQLQARWVSGMCLVLAPNDQFKRIHDIKQLKKRWLLDLLREDFPLLSIAAGLGIALSILGLAMAIFSQRLVDDILPTKNALKLDLGLVLLCTLLLVKELLAYLRQSLLLKQARQFNGRITDSFYRHLLRLPKLFFDSRKIGEFTARLNDSTRIQRVISQLAGTVAIDVLVTVVTISFLFTYSPTVALACMLLLPVYFGLIYWRHPQIASAQRDVMGRYALAEGNYISTLQGIDSIKHHNKQELFTHSSSTIYGHFQDGILRLGGIQIRLSVQANIFGVLFLMGILLFTGNQVLGGQLKTGELLAILGLCSSLLPSVANLALVAIPVNEARIAFDRLFEFTNAEAEPVSTRPETIVFESLAVSQLSFRFAGRGLLLKQVNFSVDRGECIAIMGENGCGKSTLSQLLQQHYAFDNGTITVNGNRSLQSITLDDWRSTIAVVPQAIHIFNGSVLENIAFEFAASEPDVVIGFLHANGFMHWFEALPQSVYTLVGEEGINLSGGQKQLIALARAVYHRPQLLILDEATAAMDRLTEQFVLSLLHKMKSQLAIILITHRLQVLRSFCDRIYILQDGHTEMAGSHDHLLQSDNLYSAYWRDLVESSPAQTP